jgi:hypothetical protein
MLRKSHVLIATVGLLCASGASASATDLCIRYPVSGGGMIVAKGFNPQIPPVGQENTCKPFNGTEVDFNGGPGGFLGAATGTVCVSQDGGTFLYHYSYHNFSHLRGSFDSYFESGTCRFAVHSDTKRLAGPCRGTYLTSLAGHTGQGAFQEDAEFFVCSGSDVINGQSPL